MVEVDEDIDKHSSLFIYGVNYGHKKLIVKHLKLNTMKLYFLSLSEANKLERSTLVRFSG